MISTPGIIHSMQHIPFPQPGTWKCTQVLCDGERGKDTVAGRERKILCFTLTLCIKCVFILLDKRSLIVCFKIMLSCCIFSITFDWFRGDKYLFLWIIFFYISNKKASYWCVFFVVVVAVSCSSSSSICAFLYTTRFNASLTKY